MARRYAASAGPTVPRSARPRYAFRRRSLRRRRTAEQRLYRALQRRQRLRKGDPLLDQLRRDSGLFYPRGRLLPDRLQRADAHQPLLCDRSRSAGDVLGLVPYGKIVGQTDDAPTLTYNTIGRHISKMVYTKVVTNKSPWLQGAQLGGVYTNPASHGEGRFVASEEWLDKLFANGQVATQYCDPEGNISMNEEWNVNGSYRAIEGITSPDGRVLGKMAHSERKGTAVAVNIYGDQDQKIFESGVAYFS